IVDDDLDFDLRQEVDDVFGAAIDFGVTLLPAETLDLADRHAGDADLVQRILHLIELERLDDRLDLFHRHDTVVDSSIAATHESCHAWSSGGGALTRSFYGTTSPWIARSRPSRSVSRSTRSPIARSTSFNRISETIAS